MSFVGRSDAVVALRSFARRYGEAITGPSDDEAWERLVRHQGLGGRSALGHCLAAVAELSTLAELLRSVPNTASPTASSPRSGEPDERDTIESLKAAVKRAATDAAEALDDRRDDDYDSVITIDGRSVELGRHVTDVVNRLAVGLRLIEASIESGR